MGSPPLDHEWFDETRATWGASNLFRGLNGSGVHETVAEQAHSGRRWLFYGEAGVLCYDDVSDIALLVSHAS